MRTFAPHLATLQRKAHAVVRREERMGHQVSSVEVREGADGSGRFFVRVDCIEDDGYGTEYAVSIWSPAALTSPAWAVHAYGLTKFEELYWTEGGQVAIPVTQTGRRAVR